ncbi:GAF and ANTAR domain-containing protein [Streptomyces sp. NP160]|uniref:GAF and ANTAR domain-containing protein n=1 Tax=Streptomyces sp. NP160 TaxID=2586637 RepID=UPI001119F3A0|nr:GAF and ANTAR domain-containing protein [Streptomyces sp. NP160]
MARAGTGLAAADGLCRACVDLLGVDGAAISLVHRGQSRGTFGSSGELSRRLDAYQFTYGEGPCLDAVSLSAPVLAPDLDRSGEYRWPAFTASMAQAGVRAVFALPVTVTASTVGALDLFRHTAGALGVDAFEGALAAARLAALPLLDLIEQLAERAAAGIEEADQRDPWEELASLDRTEIYQATGVLMAQGDLDSAQALVRLRARAYTEGQTASDVAWDVLEGRLRLHLDGTWQDQEEGQ